MGQVRFFGDDLICMEVTRNRLLEDIFFGATGR